METHTIPDVNLEEAKFVNSNFSMKVDVEFGQPSRDCAGLGICKISPHITDFKKYSLINDCRMTMSEIFVTDMGRLVFSFRKSKMCFRIKKLYFSNPCFMLTESIGLIKEIKAFTNYKFEMIERGSYPIIETRDEYLVSFSGD